MKLNRRRSDLDKLMKKLNYKGENEILVINSPQSFQGIIDTIKQNSNLCEDLKKAVQVDFAIIFVMHQNEIDTIVPIVAQKIVGDKTIWFCYPKKSSNKYVCEINRDNGWSIMGQYNFEPVRQVSIDDDWSAIRFRNVNYIKSITRKESTALTDKAKRITTQRGK